MIRGTLTFVVVALLFGHIARAEDKAKAREAYKSATQHYDLGEYSAALNDFKEAYRNFEEPSFLFNIAQCYRQLGQAQDAIRFYRTFLIKVPDAPNAEVVRGMIAKLEKEKPATAEKRGTTEKPVPLKIAPTIDTSANLVLRKDTSTAPARSKVPVYRRWWLWTGVVLVAAGAGVGLGLGLTSSPRYPSGSLAPLTY